MIGFAEQEKLLARLGNTLKSNTKAIVIGGSALLFYKLAKTATKDVDLVLESEKERNDLAAALHTLGFREAARSPQPEEPHIFTLGDYRLDLFAGAVFKLRLSPGIKERVKEKIVFGNLTVAVASPEDILLSKSTTDRPGDREDAASIIRQLNLDWNAIIEECRWQSQHADQRFPVFLYDFLDELVHQFGVSVPDNAVKKIKNMYRDFMERLELPKHTKP